MGKVATTSRSPELRVRSAVTALKTNFRLNATAFAKATKTFEAIFKQKSRPMTLGQYEKVVGAVEIFSRELIFRTSNDDEIAELVLKHQQEFRKKGFYFFGNAAMSSGVLPSLFATNDKWIAVDLLFIASDFECGLEQHLGQLVSLGRHFPFDLIAVTREWMDVHFKRPINDPIALAKAIKKMRVTCIAAHKELKTVDQIATAAPREPIISFKWKYKSPYSDEG